jgi:hypothetical protein
LDRTDKEINAAEYGAAPDGHHFLVIGHEGFGQVEAVGDNVAEVKLGDYDVATVRRPGSSLYDVIGTNDMTTDDTYCKRGINLRHGYLTERGNVGGTGDGEDHTWPTASGALCGNERALRVNGQSGRPATRRAPCRPDGRTRHAIN